MENFFFKTYWQLYIEINKTNRAHKLIITCWTLDILYCFPLISDDSRVTITTGCAKKRTMKTNYLQLRESSPKKDAKESLRSSEVWFTCYGPKKLNKLTITLLRIAHGWCIALEKTRDLANRLNKVIYVVMRLKKESSKIRYGLFFFY